MLRVEAQVGTELKVLSHGQSSHDDIILETHGWRTCKLLRAIQSLTLSQNMCAFRMEYLNHVGRAEPEFRRDDFAIHQDFPLPQSGRVFPACKYIQESDSKRKKLILMPWGSYVCETVPICSYTRGHVSYDVLPLPVAPMIAFIPGLMMPLQQPNTK